MRSSMCVLIHSSTHSQAAFNILCEHPETSAAFLASRVRTAVARDMRNVYIKSVRMTVCVRV